MEQASNLSLFVPERNILRQILEDLRTQHCLISKKVSLNELHKLLKSTDGADDIMYDIMMYSKDFLCQLVDAVVAGGLVKDFKCEEMKEYTRSDFKELPETAEVILRCLHVLVERLQNQQYSSDVKWLQMIVFPMTVLCASHSNEDFPWTSSASVKLAGGLLDKLCTLCHCDSLDQLVNGVATFENAVSFTWKGLVSPLLEFLKTKLMRNNWKMNPSACHVYHWMLLHIKYPVLSEELGEILPPSLLFVDDYMLKNKILGVTCLHYIVINVPPTELKWHGRADVIHHALFQLIYTREPPLIDKLHPCLLSLLAGMAKDPNQDAEPRKPGKYDDIYVQLLIDMELEQRLNLRQAYSVHLPKYIDKLGITVVRHMKRTMRVLLQYLNECGYSGPEEVTTMNMLKALKMLFIVAWPRIPFQCSAILKSLLQLLYKLASSSSTVTDPANSEIISEIEDLMLCLKGICPVEFKACLKGIEAYDDIPGISVVRNVLNASVEQ